ncbi:MAG: tRNA (adenosine(37)-N6)-dimethylallyltransferase MiaA [Bdellovibrionales bacterium]|nr:tRNA (adenosine(37)-N6)-dimethylallyltransferase MiaA [Bdellovibrionales bacterium]
MRFASDLILALAGPTGSGKSTLSLALARYLRGLGQETEIICCDSITVYRGFDIGSAKPSREERGAFPHHLLDIRDAEENFTAAEFAREADAAIAGIRERGALPLLVGGTGFYLRALLQGMTEESPEETEQAAELKASLAARADSEGLESLYREMIALDPHLQIHPNDRYRIIRSLQVMRATGKKWSELNQEARAREPRYRNVRLFWIDLDREELRGRIEARTEEMIHRGLLEEVRGHLIRGVPPDAKPLQSVGYKEALAHLQESGDRNTDRLRSEIVQGTMRLAKAQRTWFRGEPLAERLDQATLETLLRQLEP